MSTIKRPNILEVNTLYLLLAATLLYVGSMVQRREIYSGLLITEYILILLPSLVFLKFGGFRFKEVLRLNRISLKEICLVVLITIFAYPLVAFIQAIFIGVLSMFKDINPNDIPVPMDNIGYLYSFFVICISPGICEEIMFRGLVMSAYDRLGPSKSIIITGILFGMFHFTVVNLIGPILLGILFGFLVHRTNSIYSSIIGHTINNGIALTILYNLNKYGDRVVELSSQSELIGNSDLIKSGMILLIFMVICIVILRKLINMLPKQANQGVLIDNHSFRQGFETTNIFSYLPIIVSIILFVYINSKFVLS